MNKVTVITGASSGIGFETALQLAQKQHHILMVCRSEERGNKAKEKIEAIVPGVKIGLEIADLSEQKQIRFAAERITKDYPAIDNLINNAGIWSSKRELTSDAIEKVFAVNHLAYFLFTHLLYPSVSNSTDGRIINVSSDSHFQSSIHFEDLSLEKNYHGLRSYGQSKLANVLFTYELQRRKPHDKVSVNAVQPGLVKTDIGIKDTILFHRLAWKIRRSGGVDAGKGASTSVYLASVDDLNGHSGKYWDKMKPKQSSPKSYCKEDAAKLWNISEELCKIPDYFNP